MKNGEKTFSFELVPGSLKASGQLPEHFCPNHSGQNRPSNRHAFGLHPTPYLILRQTHFVKFIIIRNLLSCSLESLKLGKLLDTCVECLWVGLTVNKFLEEREEAVQGEESLVDLA